MDRHLSFSVAEEEFAQARFRRQVTSFRRREIMAWIKAAGALVCMGLAALTAAFWQGSALVDVAARLITALDR